MPPNSLSFLKDSANNIGHFDQSADTQERIKNIKHIE